ncbi:MAG: esterase family protein [Treponema sp.]|jgi:S-formylglutathione hydrolase FrmB|nr:esterase family protein [Treponema sp.]
MALIHAHFFSSALGMQRTMDVVLPQGSNGIGVEGRKREGPIPVLYLLHGWSDDHTIWQRRTSIERYALDRGIAVIMPSTDLGFYTDMKYGYDFWEFFSRELPEIAAEFFPNLSSRREDTFVAGLSMGGFGALKLAINCPERFAAAASLSGLTDPLWQYRNNRVNEAWLNVFGEENEVRGSLNDLPFQLEKLIASGQEMPRFFMTCGTEDFLFELNTQFRDQFSKRIDLTWHQEKGVHDWAYWDRNIQRVLDWLPVGRNKKEGE